MPDAKELHPAAQAKVDAATVATAIAGARKTAAEAASAEASAATASLKAGLGEAAAAPFSGAVEVSEGGGLAELNLLAQRKLVELADVIVKKVIAVTSSGVTILVTSAAKLPDFGHDGALLDRQALCEELSAGAIAVSQAAMGDTGTTTAAPFAAIGLVLAGSNALLGYLRSDFRIAGVALTPTDRALVALVAGKLAANNRSVLVDGFFPAIADAERKVVRDAVGALSITAAEIRLRLAGHAATLQAIDASAAKVAAGAAPDYDGDAVNDQPRHEQALAACQAAIQAFDAFAAALYDDADGTPFLERALVERGLRKRLQAGAVLSVKVEGAWGGCLVRKDIRAGFQARVPMQVRSAVTVSWGVCEAISAKLLGAGTESASSELLDIQAV